jgi:hypothetical protein
MKNALVIRVTCHFKASFLNINRNLAFIHQQLELEIKHTEDHQQRLLLLEPLFAQIRAREEFDLIQLCQELETLISPRLSFDDHECGRSSATSFWRKPQVSTQLLESRYQTALLHNLRSNSVGDQLFFDESVAVIR